MAHEVESMVSVREVPWHKLGVVVPNALTSEEALRLGGLDWKVRKEPIYARIGADFHLVEGRSAIVRSSDNAILGDVGSRYTPIQNAQALDFFDSVVGSKEAMYETAGSLRGGRKVFITAKLPGTIRVTREDGDVVEKYLLLATSHDGSGANRMLFTPTRVVCANTLAAALRGSAGEGVSIRHTTNATAKIEAAQVALGIAVKFYDQLGESLKALAAHRFSDGDMKEFAAELLPGSVKEKDGKKVLEVSTRTENNRMKLLELFSSGVGQVGEVRGTAWAAYNAATEYIDHTRSTRVGEGEDADDVRADAVLFGAGAAFKQKAFDSLQARLAA